MTDTETILYKPIVNLAQVLCFAQPIKTGQTGSCFSFKGTHPLGPECFQKFVKGLFAAGFNINFRQLPICYPCMSEILYRENMALIYDASCSFPTGSNAY